MDVEALLHAIPPLAVYLVVGGVVGLESLGIPLPGEIILVSAALMSSHDDLPVNPVGVGVAAVIGAVIGDSIGYAIGRRFGMPLFDRLGRRFPKHFGPGHVALAEKLFNRWGVRAVFFGRFIALLRIFAGPLAGALKMHYPRFFGGQRLGGPSVGPAAPPHWCISPGWPRSAGWSGSPGSRSSSPSSAV
ncbi:hypothetical protein MPRS_00210 [Mycobacterium paraseoulense]|nr:hypothetical protein MPRS_00210 [Mycobacterium paraseoulense]